MVVISSVSNASDGAGREPYTISVWGGLRLPQHPRPPLAQSWRATHTGHITESAGLPEASNPVLRSV